MDTPGIFLNLATSVLVIGRWGVTKPSWERMLIFDGCLGNTWELEFQGIRMSAGSESQGFVSMMSFIKSAVPPRLELSGPPTKEKYQLLLL